MELDEKGTQRVLVVDDEPRILTSLADLLEEEFEVVSCLSAEEGLKALEALPVAVVLSDQRMAGMKGDEFLARATRLSRATRILITGYSDLSAVVSAVNRGQIYAFVSKPWNPAQLLAMVRAAHQHYVLLEELHRERFLLRTLMETIPDTIAFKDSQRRFLRINRAQAALLGAGSPEAALGKTLAELGQRDLDRQAAACEEQVLATGEALLDVTTRVGEDRWLSTTRVPLREHGTVCGLIEVSRDITERLHRTRQLERVHRELRQFMHVSAHHLQEPLRAVVSYLELLARRCELGEEARDYVGQAVAGAVRMKRLLRDFLAYSEVPDTVREGTVDCSALVSQVLETLPPEAEGIVQGTLPAVRGDERMLGRLFTELVGNALKFRRGEPPRVELSARTLPAEWEFSVCDNGMGIEADFRGKAFDIFSRLHGEDFPGTGMGLALCRKIVELHGGRIWIERAPEPMSTRVLFRLPRARTERGNA